LPELLEFPEPPDGIDPSVEEQAVADNDESARTKIMKTAETIPCDFISSSLPTRRQIRLRSRRTIDG
jgi:hypothetical protein